MHGRYESFAWNLPYEVDKSEPEITVRFWFDPGNGKTPRFPHDPDADPPTVEDVTFEHGGKAWHLDGIRRGEWTDAVIDACWDYLNTKDIHDPI